MLARLPHDALFPEALRRAFRLDRWDTDAQVRARWMVHGVQRFEALIARFATVTEVEFSIPIWRASIDIMAQTNLRSHDAIHVATARAAAVRDFATVDAHFRRVSDLNVRLIRDPSP